MPALEEVEYSRNETVQAFRDYNEFMYAMYIETSHTIHPHADGSPNLTSESGRDFGKSGEVNGLLRHIPCIKKVDTDPWGDHPHSVAACKFHDFTEPSTRSHDPTRSEDDGSSLRFLTDDCLQETVFSHVTSLSSGKSDEAFLLDTNSGIVHWIECSSDWEEKHNRGSAVQRVSNRNDAAQWHDISDLSDSESGAECCGSYQNDEDQEIEEKDGDPKIIEMILDDVYGNEWAPEEEDEWRGDSGVWAIPDVFELVKLQLRAPSNGFP